MTRVHKNRIRCQLCSQEVTLDRKGRLEAHRKASNGKLIECAGSGAEPYVEAPGFDVFAHIKKANS